MLMNLKMKIRIDILILELLIIAVVFGGLYEKIAIISYGGLPLPPVKGGAVENLIQFFVENNEIQKKAEI